MSGGGCRKADLIRKVLAADLLQLPILPSMGAKEKEITDRRLVKLKVDGITIPFSEDIEQGWMKDFVYFPDLTMDCIRDYAKKSSSEKDDCFGNISIPRLTQFFYDFIVPEMFTKKIYNKRVCQDTLDSIINKVVQVADQEKVQHELNQLTILSLPPPVTTSTVSGVKRKSSVAGPQLKKK